MTLADRVNALPLWSGPVEPVPLTGGLSNESATVTDGGRRYVVRFGRDLPFHHVVRAHEAMAARAAHAAGFAPEVVHAADGAMVSRFIDARTLAAGDVRADIARIPALVPRLPDGMPRHVGGSARLFWPFHVIRDYARTLAAGGSRMAGRLDGFTGTAAALEQAQVPLPIVFGHHDFLPANLLDDGARLWIIDFEYAAFGTPMFDLAGLASNAGFSAAESEALLGHYFGAPPDAALRRSHAAMQCASLLREAMWGMVSELHMSTPGVDYAAYADQNLAVYAAALDGYQSRYGKV